MFGFALTPALCRGMGAAPPPVQHLREFFQPDGGQQVALAETVDGDITVWTEIGSQHAAMLRLDNSNPAFRLSWRETLVAELRNIFPVGALTLTSGWSQLQSSGSGLSGSYTGNRAISAYSASAAASVTVDRTAPYDLWIYYTGRTSGGYCRVEIDGDQALVNEIDDPAGLGFKAFSTYSATDSQRRLSVKVASGLMGSHTVNLRSGGVASPGGSALVIEAVGISGALSDPYILPPAWQPGATYTPGDEVQHGGIFYAARAAGTSGMIGPTHANGIASDGALDWRADNRPTYPKFVAIDYASEREYAARFTVDGAATELGGQTHGHEMLETRTILLDGEPWLPSGAGLSVGAQITITEETIWQQASGADVASCQLQRSITPGAVRHDVTVTGTGPAADVDWLYTGMAPMVRWDGERAATVVDTVAVADSPPVTLSSYAGTTPANLDYPDARRVGITADLLGTDLIYGMESGPASVPGAILNQFDTILRPNLGAASESGGLDWEAKAYVSGAASGGLTLGAGDMLGFFSRHVLRVDP